MDLHNNRFNPNNKNNNHNLNVKVVHTLHYVKTLNSPLKPDNSIWNAYSHGQKPYVPMVNAYYYV